MMERLGIYLGRLRVQLGYSEVVLASEGERHSWVFFRRESSFDTRTARIR
jgi:hypothetical protein